jgi:hypothetical protein
MVSPRRRTAPARAPHLSPTAKSTRFRIVPSGSDDAKPQPVDRDPDDDLALSDAERADLARPDLELRMPVGDNGRVPFLDANRRGREAWQRAIEGGANKYDLRVLGAVIVDLSLYARVADRRSLGQIAVTAGLWKGDAHDCPRWVAQKVAVPLNRLAAMGAVAYRPGRGPGGCSTIELAPPNTNPPEVRSPDTNANRPEVRSPSKANQPGVRSTRRKRTKTSAKANQPQVPTQERLTRETYKGRQTTTLRVRRRLTTTTALKL